MKFPDNDTFARRLTNESDGSSRQGIGKDPYHGRSYHKFFEGYTEYPSYERRGKIRISRVYTAPYYKASLSAPRYIGIRFLYFCLTALSSFLYTAAMLMNIPSNYSRFVALFEALSIADLFFFCIYLISYIISRPMLTIRKYRTISTMQGLAKSTVLFQGIVAVGAVVYAFLNKESFLTEIGNACLILISGALLLSIHLIEKKITYEIIPNLVKVDVPDAVLIEPLK